MDEVGFIGSRELGVSGDRRCDWKGRVSGDKETGVVVGGPSV